MLAGVETRTVVLLLDDSQLVSEVMTEDINAVLNSADVPNLYTPEDFDKVSSPLMQLHTLHYLCRYIRHTCVCVRIWF